jgi:hypothetical protein
MQVLQTPLADSDYHGPFGIGVEIGEDGINARAMGVSFEYLPLFKEAIMEDMVRVLSVNPSGDVQYGNDCLCAARVTLPPYPFSYQLGRDPVPFPDISRSIIKHVWPKQVALSGGRLACIGTDVCWCASRARTLRYAAGRLHRTLKLFAKDGFQYRRDFVRFAEGLANDRERLRDWGWTISREAQTQPG